MSIRWNRSMRRVHFWCALLAALPVLVTIATGLLLQLKKDVEWIQPATRKGAGGDPSISFDTILAAARSVPEAGITEWSHVDRLDVRPDKGVVKVRGKNRTEVQVCTTTGKVLQVAYRRSDLIETLHDGSWFHDWAKLGLFLPAGIGLLVLWVTGIYMLLLPWQVKRRRRKNELARGATSAAAPGGADAP